MTVDGPSRPMLGIRLARYRPSLRRWAHLLGLIWLIGAGILAPVSMTLLNQICDDAQSTYMTEIPSLLDRNRNAVKLERLSSFLRTIASTHDPQVERRFLVQVQALAQGFDLDNNARLSAAAAQAVASAQKIIASHATLRRLETVPRSGTGDPDTAAKIREVERSAEQVDDAAVQVLNSMTDYLTTDAALTADGMANRIQRNAWRIKQGCLAAFSFFIVSGILFLLIFQRHVLTPIAVAVRGLESLSTSDGGPIELPRARFFELDMIGRSVEQYARFVGDLRMANLALHTLSKQDSLTGLANRRSFDVDLGGACRRVAEGSGRSALLLIDIDHFKLLNDRFGHLVGDQCLRQVAMTLQSFGSRRGDQAARYGGEEFALIVSDVTPGQARDVAEHLRAAVERTQLHVTGVWRAIDVTVSIGVALMQPGETDTPEAVIAAADAAMYRAKRNGRNCVCVSEPDQEPPAVSLSAA